MDKKTTALFVAFALGIGGMSVWAVQYYGRPQAASISSAMDSTGENQDPDGSSAELGDASSSADSVSGSVQTDAVVSGDGGPHYSVSSNLRDDDDDGERDRQGGFFGEIGDD